MTATVVAPCAPWATVTDLPEGCDDAAVKPGTVAQALLHASVILFNLTNRRWRGLCTDTYRPLDGGCWACTHADRSVDHAALRLPAVGVRAITEVKVLNVIQAATTYELRDGRYLWRKSDAAGVGPTAWPCTQNLTRTDLTVDSFEVSYTWGQAPPAEFVAACARLAWEFAVAWTPDCTTASKLPPAITSISRGGITTSYPDAASIVARGMTGLRDVDMLVASVQRGEARQRPTIGVPGRGRTGSRS